MSSPRIATRYAKALLKLSNGDPAKVKKYLSTLAVTNELFTQKESGRIMRSPVMPADLKQSLLNYALKQADASGGELALFLTAVVEAGRISMLPEIYSAYSALIDAAEGKAEAEVISAVTLSDEDVKSIEATLSKILHKKVTVNATVDATVLGGFVARIGNYLVDLSLKTKLDELAKSAVQATV